MKHIQRKNMLYKSGVEYADYALTHVHGCSHGCNFPCYAMNLDKRRGKIRTNAEWNNPELVENSLELVENELEKYGGRIKSVFLSFMTDVFMYGQPEVRNLSLKIIQKLNSKNIRCITLTKGIHAPMNDFDYHPDNEYGITLLSLDENFRKIFEPFTAPYAARIRALKKIHDSGKKTWISMEPYPTPNIINQNLEKILESLAFTDKIIFGRWNDNNLVTQYLKRDPLFYHKLAERVLDFCKSGNIEVAFKRGTRINEDPSIKEIFTAVD
jgi:DNA repair photolyase